MKKRNIFLLSALALLLALPSFAQKMQTIRGEGRYVSTAVEKVGSFNAIDIRGDADVEFIQQPSVRVLVSGRENLVKLADVRVEDGVLVVGFSEPVHVRGEYHLKVTVSAPQLKAVSVKQGGDFEMRGVLKASDISFTAEQDSEISVDWLEADSVAVMASGRSEVDLSRIEAARVRAVAADRAGIELSGKVGEASLENNGSTELDADDLRADIVHAYVNGSGDVKTFAVKSLHAVANGRGKIEYKGNPASIDREGNTKKIVRDRDY